MQFVYYIHYCILYTLYSKHTHLKNESLTRALVSGVVDKFSVLEQKLSNSMVWSMIKLIDVEVWGCWCICTWRFLCLSDLWPICSVVFLWVAATHESHDSPISGYYPDSEPVSRFPAVTCKRGSRVLHPFLARSWFDPPASDGASTSPLSYKKEHIYMCTIPGYSYTKANTCLYRLWVAENGHSYRRKHIHYGNYGLHRTNIEIAIS